MGTQNRLKQILSIKRMSQAELAQFGNVKPATVSRYLAGRQIDTEFVISLKDNLGINPTWLLTGEGEMFLNSTKESKFNINVNGSGGSHNTVISGDYNNYNNYSSQMLTDEEFELVQEIRKSKKKDMIEKISDIIKIFILAITLYSVYNSIQSSPAKTEKVFVERR